MKVIVVASGKGGTGKSLISANIAIRLARRRKNEKVAMIDLNRDQGTLTQWWVLRGRGVSPYLVEKPSGVIDDVRALAAQGYHWCVVDTPPTDTEINEFAILVADLVIVPVRAAFLDLNATQMITDACKKRRKRYAFLINAFDARPAFKKANTEALELLEGQGPIFDTKLPYSAKFIEGQSSGKTGPEIDKALCGPVDALIDEITEMLGDARKVRSAVNA